MNAKHFASLAAAILAAFLFFGTVAGCEPDAETKYVDTVIVSELPDYLAGGTFMSASGDGYAFTETELTRYSQDWSSGSPVAVSGTYPIKAVRQFSATAGVIVFKIPSGKSADPGFGDPATALYGAVYYKDLTVTSVKAGSTYALSADDVKVRSLSAPGSTLQGTLKYYLDPANEPTEMGMYGDYTKQ
jgi:hypothetical protein